MYIQIPDSLGRQNQKKKRVKKSKKTWNYFNYIPSNQQRRAERN